MHLCCGLIYIAIGEHCFRRELRKILTMAVFCWWNYRRLLFSLFYTFPAFSTFCFKTSHSCLISEKAWLLLSQGSLGSGTELSSFPGRDRVTNCVVRTGSGSSKRIGRGALRQPKITTRAQGPGGQEPKWGGHREVCWCDTGSGSSDGFGLMGEPFGGYTTGSCSLPAGGQLGLGSLPSLLQRVEAALEWGQGREAQERKGPGSTSQAKRY